MKQKIFIILSSIFSILIFFFFIELFSGYLFFKRLIPEKFASIYLIDSISKKSSKNEKEKKSNSEFGTDELNPFVHYPKTIGKQFDSNINNYRFHPFVDFSGMKKKVGENNQDYFGFRDNDNSLYFRKREKDEFLILMTGGSEAAGWTHKISIIERIKLKIQQDPRFKNKKISVLNLAMSSHTLSNEINAFINLAWHSKPDIVISHTGWNDFMFGPKVPKPFQLLGLHYFVGQIEWMSRLYALEDNSIMHQYLDCNLTFSNCDTNHDIVLERFFMNLKKYSELVKSNGGKFIFGLQGFNYKDDKKRNDNARELTRRASNLAKEKNLDVVDFSQNKDWSFADSIHTVDKTADLIASEYVKKISKEILNK
tara:strand:- start:29 stop:1132 length:1104 start_codon:yes stop_codon:yes gene_type:complete